MRVVRVRRTDRTRPHARPSARWTRRQCRRFFHRLRPSARTLIRDFPPLSILPVLRHFNIRSRDVLGCTSGPRNFLTRVEKREIMPSRCLSVELEQIRSWSRWKSEGVLEVYHLILTYDCYMMVVTYDMGDYYWYCIARTFVVQRIYGTRAKWKTCK